MFNIGFTEFIILGIIGLLVIGPEQLPDMARRLGRMLNDLKRAKDEMMSPVEEMKNEAQGAIDRLRRNVDEQVNSQVSEIMNAVTPIEDEKTSTKQGSAGAAVTAAKSPADHEPIESAVIIDKSGKKHES